MCSNGAVQEALLDALLAHAPVGIGFLGEHLYVQPQSATPGKIVWFELRTAP